MKTLCIYRSPHVVKTSQEKLEEKEQNLENRRTIRSSAPFSSCSRFAPLQLDKSNAKLKMQRHFVSSFFASLAHQIRASRKSLAVPVWAIRFELTL